jgi:hypothetical protein
MPLRNYTNTSKEGQLLSPIGTGDTTIVLSPPGLVNIPATPFYVRLDQDTASEEIVLAGSGSSATTLLNCTRGYDGTSAFSHAAGIKVRHCVAAELYNKADAHVEATTNVHGLSGGSGVAGTTQTQTLTNKTINSSIIDLAHTTSPAGSQAYKVSADNATSRDGFVWDNTGGSAGRAFVVRAAGVDRLAVTGAGLMTSNSGSGTDKALSVQTSGVERFFLQNDGHADFALQAGGATVDRVRIRAQATQNALAVKNSGGTDIALITGAGAISGAGLSSTTTVSATNGISAGTTLSSGTTTTVGTDLTVNGNATITGTSTHTGTSSFVGDSTWALPGGGTTPRIIVNSRTGGTNFQGKRQDGFVTSSIDAAGEMLLNAKAFIHNKISPVTATVGATADVPSPTTGVVVFDEFDRQIKRWTGAAWEVVGYYGTNNYIRYRNTADQSIPHNTVTKVQFPTGDVTHTATVTVASNTDFTLVKAGLYLIEANTMHEADANGSRWFFLADASNSANRYAVDTQNPNNNAACAQQFTSLRRFTAGAVLSAYVFQDSGVANPLTGSLPSLCPTHINITWLGP